MIDYDNRSGTIHILNTSQIAVEDKRFERRLIAMNVIAFEW